MEMAYLKIIKEQVITMHLQRGEAMQKHNASLVFSTPKEMVSIKTTNRLYTTTN